MYRIKLWLWPIVMIVAWITVLSYTVSMVSTVEPTLRGLEQGAGRAPRA